MQIRTKALADLAVVAADGFGFEDIFSTFFGGSTRRRDPNAPRKGDDLQYSMTIDFMEAVFGKETEIEIPKEETCDTCDGSGAKKGTPAKTCSHCSGSGQISVTQNTPFGQMVNRRACPHCQGTGKIIPEKCGTCHGEGRVTKTKKIKVTIPEGVDDGQQLRVSGQGEAGIMAAQQVICISYSVFDRMKNLSVKKMIFIWNWPIHSHKLHLVMKSKCRLCKAK